MSVEDRIPPLKLLEESLRGGTPVPPDFTKKLRESARKGETVLLAAYLGEKGEKGENVVGVLVLAYRLNIAAGGCFASIEELHVSPEARSQGVGRALLNAAAEHWSTHGVSYVEVQAEGEAAGFYAALGYEREEGVEVLSRSYPL
ncbi:MAG: GNAT family N-acetyltransferase [Rubrobacteraceae bacterium]